VSALAFAWRSLVRQPARAVLGVLGVAAVGALLFDMLLLSRGLVLSMQQLLDQVGFDVRVMASAGLPRTGVPIRDARSTAAAIEALDEVSAAVPVALTDAAFEAVGGGRASHGSLLGAGASRLRAWTILDGRDLAQTSGVTDEVLINEALADRSSLRVGDRLTVRPECHRANSALPARSLRVAGIARFPFQSADASSAAVSLDDFAAACGVPTLDEADLILVAVRPDTTPDTARSAIARLRPDLQAVTNEQVVAQLQQAGFSYFRQISTVLASVTLVFGLLLISVLLTVSVNQRLGEIAALRALGFSARRVVADVMCESALMVGIGGALSLPLGAALSQGLDRILTSMPGIPADLHFFVFEPRALGLHAALLVVTAVGAALYPMSIVARLPIAATLRREVVS
jgi:putative ABC transport system permease protein